jgi:hypothetical protein
MPTEAQTRALSYGPQPDIAAASLRAPMRGEILPITVTTASKRFAVPELWKGSFVRVQADGGDVYIQVSAAADAGVDYATARAGETLNNGTITLAAPTGANTGGFKVPDGTWLDVPFPANAQTFALIGSAACVARCHLSET